MGGVIKNGKDCDSSFGVADLLTRGEEVFVNWLIVLSGGGQNQISLFTKIFILVTKNIVVLITINVHIKCPFDRC